MDGVQPNGEPKRIYLSKENGRVEGPTTSRRSSVNQPVYIPPPRRQQRQENVEEEEHLSNHKKQRYWNSYEEMYIVELWRRYKDEVCLNIFKN